MPLWAKVESKNYVKKQWFNKIYAFYTASCQFLAVAITSKNF
jgi:hypothetical protein